MAASGTYGNVDFFGLDEFGMPAGMNPMWGAVAGVGLATGTAIAVRKFATTSPNLQKYSELVGAGVAAAVGGALMMFGGLRAAGLTAALAGLVGNGLRQIEHSIALAPVIPGATAGYGRAFGERTIEPRTAFQGGLGMVTTEPRTALLSGLHGARRGPQFVGPPSLADGHFAANPAARHVQLVGGPPMSQLSSLYGSNHFNKN